MTTLVVARLSALEVSRRGVDPRLRLTGASVTGIIAGRLLAMTGAGVVLALGYWTMVAVDQNLPHLWAAGVMMLVSALVAAPVGSLIGAILPRELDGALALLSISSVQMLADPAGLIAKLMPFWSAREVGNYAVDGGSIDLVWRGLAHAGVTWLICVLGTLAVFHWRLRLVRYPEP